MNSENLPYIIDNFADFSSLEIHFAKRESVNFVYESVKNHPYKISAEIYLIYNRKICDFK